MDLGFYWRRETRQERRDQRSELSGRAWEVFGAIYNRHPIAGRRTAIIASPAIESGRCGGNPADGGAPPPARGKAFPEEFGRLDIGHAGQHDTTEVEGSM